MIQRPEFIKHYTEIQEADSCSYPNSKELLSIGSPFGRAFGLKKLGIHHELLPPGRRTSWPHAESAEEEFVYVIEGNPDVWINGNIYSLKPGDAVGFPSGTGISHTFINNTESDVRLLVVGEASKKENKIYYPLNPSRQEQCKDSWWHDIPKQHECGSHDGLPDRLRVSNKIHKS
ncbi:MAG: cupin domain-containing protein [Deltaproteobacteria bacterium]|nr:cupin domain-containing protein [Deltaproteobacteria bacterium]